MLVTLEPWGSGDLALLERLMGDARMTAHLGGPERAAKLRERQDRYQRLDGGDRIAVAATAQAIELAKRDDTNPFMHAFPNIDNAPSNAICRKLGFELLAVCEFEFPKGHSMTCNDWQLDLRA